MCSIATSRGELSAGDYSAPFELSIPSELAGLRLDQALARMFPEHSRSRLAAWVRDGRVTVDAARAEAKRKVRGGERIALTAASVAAEQFCRGQAIPLDIVFEDESLLVVDKRAGLVVHPGAGNRDGTLANALLAHAPQVAAVPRSGIVHRLDKDTSGLLVVAKSLEAHTHLVRQIATRTAKREYFAVVHGSVGGAGEVDAPIGRHPRLRTRMAVTARGKPARTRYQVVERLRQATLLAVSLETGRTHQIRLHMHAIGHPVVGDPTYGKRLRADAEAALTQFPRQALHAARLALVHPATGNACEWSSPLPADMHALVKMLRR